MKEGFLGDYELVKQIGRGTLGDVYLAEHRFMKRQFVIKVLPKELAEDRAFIKRFESEVALLASMDHPHIVQVHTVSFADGAYFLVTDCIVDAFGETTNLGQYLSIHKQRLSENEVLELLTQVASALDYMHAKGVVHRNLKLGNILVGKGNKGIHLSLSDAGLTQLVGEGAVLTRMYASLAEALSLERPRADGYFTGAIEGSKLTKLHASFLQSYHFFAPEQKLHRERTLGTSVDAYAFGVLAYFLVMRSYPEGFFPLPSKVYPDNRIHWDELIHQCLTPDPNKRPQSLSRLIDQMLSPRSHSPKRDHEIHMWNRPEGSAPRLDEDVSFEKEPSHVATATAPSETLEKLIEEAKPKPLLNPQEVERPNYEEDPRAAFAVEKTVAKYVPQEKEVSDITPIDTDMTVIRGGEFRRGSNKGGRDERPEHTITLSDFAIDVHPVTNEQFVRFLEVMGGEKDANNNDIIRLKDSRIKRLSGKLSVESGYSKHPVIGVTWYGAVAYAKWVGKRLPTEAEWEVAARSGLEEALYPTGPAIERSQANFFSSDTTAVKSYPPNSYGLYDMAGNVYEWCQDWYDYNYYETSQQEPENPQGPLQGVYRVLRGGCWKSLKEDMRCAHRHRNNPGTVNTTYSFRCAANVDSKGETA
jgi:formylglycine-generating enzyme required for sulfatase activity/tRNA A-37 threonylcarbamoyl transferase component Bud32